jgi:hypothetical protein
LAKFATGVIDLYAVLAEEGHLTPRLLASALKAKDIRHGISQFAKNNKRN